MSAPATRKVRVELGERSYDVLIGPGLLQGAAGLLPQRFGGARYAIVTDERVAASGHLAALEASLKPSGKLLGSVAMPPGESTKCFAELARLTEALLSMGVERRDLVIALGGGVIGDLAGFASSLLRRGVRFVQIPTSLLAQVDSSVGGKTGINTAQGKNLAGAFHQPSLVLADTALLSTLPDREMRAGYAEVAKYGLLGDADFFRWLESNAQHVLAREPAALIHAVARSVEMKAEIVARDETEQGDRMLLNLGHTFGHAFEAWAGFSDRLLHGEAVALGTALAFRFSEELGICPSGTAARVATHLDRLGLPTTVAQIPSNMTGKGKGRPQLADIMRLMSQDKKVQDGRLTFILARDIGSTFVSRDIGREQTERFLASEIASN